MLKSSSSAHQQQVLIHPSSLSKMQQIKNIYCMQSSQTKFNLGATQTNVSNILGHHSFVGVDN